MAGAARPPAPCTASSAMNLPAPRAGLRSRVVLTAEGERAGAEREVRAVWQSAEMSAELEAAVLDMFQGALTPTDDTARMDRRIGCQGFQRGDARRQAPRSRL